MIKNNFIRNTLILLIGGFITKILAMVIKIIMTRIIGTEGISIYMLVVPTFNLFIVLSQMGFPISISKLVSENKIDNKKLIISSLYLSIFISIILIIIIILFAKSICKFLHNSLLYFPILSIGVTLPFISISSIIRSYFFGKEDVLPHVISNFIEQILRIIIYITILQKLKVYGITFLISFIILSSVICEICSIFVLYLFLPNKIKLKKEEIKPNLHIIKDILNISLPNTGSKIVGTISYFFEPIIITSIMLFLGFKQSYITKEYGIITGYIFPLLLMPSFFSMAISQSTLPVISKACSKNNKKYVKKKVKQSLLFSLVIGLFFTIIYIIFPKELLKLIYNTTEGSKYLKITTPFFLLQYIQSPLVSIMQGMDKSKESFHITLIGILIKNISMIILLLLNFKLYSLIISTILNIIYVTYFNFIKVKKSLL